MINGNEKIPENESGEERIERLESENRILRRTWWWNHGCDFFSLYGDDGEMQCGRCMVDFKRDRVEEIIKRVDLQRTRDAVEAHTALAKERGKCEQCQKPWYDGLCECEESDDEEWQDRCQYIANMAFFAKLEHI